MRQSRTALWTGTLLGVLATVLMFGGVGYASDRDGMVSEELHQTYPLAADGRIDVENINGPVHISVWDRSEVKVDAIKRAWSKQRLDEAHIDISAHASSLSIRTEYPGHDHTFWSGGHDNPASVEYTLVVPRRVRLDEIKLVNGELDVQDVQGDVHASCVNGRLRASNLGGRADLNTVNGELEASVGSTTASLQLAAVNGTLRLTLPSDVKADVEASTISGRISNDFGLTASRHQFVGNSLRGELGGGGAQVKLSSVNGRIEILRAHDNRPLGPVKNTERGDRDDDDDRI